MASVQNPNTTDWSNSFSPLLTPSKTKYDVYGKMQTVTLRDYQHAARIFVDGNFRLSPKYGFLFYVEFDFNPLVTNVSNTSAQELGMIVKNVSLPKFTMQVKEHNAYNRKNLVQNSIKYDPINIVFHDDQADNVRNFWYDYYSFYYRDSDYADATYQLISKYQERPSFEWGYTPRNNGSYNSNNAYQNYQYIQAIRIYSLYQKNFDEYELVNPIITSFKHGEHANGENTALLEHTMSIQFETVKYQTGYVTDNTAGGFVDLHYDATPSILAPNGQTDVVGDGKGGFTTTTHTVTDLAYFNTTVNGGVVVPPPNGILGTATSASTTAGIAGTSLLPPSNPGGFALPSLGTLTTGINNSTLISGQLTQASQQASGQAASTLAGGVVAGVGQALGTQGTQAVGLAVAALSNPSGALATVESMALKFATSAATTALNQVASKGAEYLQKEVASGLTTLNNDIGSYAYGDGTTLTSGLAGSFQNVKQDFTNLLNGNGFQTNAELGSQLAIQDADEYDAPFIESQQLSDTTNAATIQVTNAFTNVVPPPNPNDIVDVSDNIS